MMPQDITSPSGKQRLSELLDVSLAGLADNDLLEYENATSLWKNVPPSPSDLTIAQRQTAGIHPTYVIYQDPTSSEYYAKATRSGLADYGPEADAFDIFDPVDNQMNALGGAQAFIKIGNFDFDTIWHPRNFNEWVGENFQSTVLRAGSSSINPVIDIDRQEGTDTRQEKIRFDNLKIDGGNYTNMDCLHIHNLKDSLFHRLFIGNWRRYGIYADGNSSSGFSFWLDFDKIFLEEGSTVTAGMYFSKYVWDSIIQNVTGTVTGGYGFHLRGAANVTLRHVHLMNTSNMVRIDSALAGGGSGNGIQIINSMFDTCSSHSLYIDASYYSIYHLLVDGCEWIVPPANMDLVYVNIATSVNFGRSKFINNSCGVQDHRYIFNVQGAGTFQTNNRIVGNHWRDGSAGAGILAFNGVDSDCVRDDFTWLQEEHSMHGGCISALATNGTDEYFAVCGLTSPNVAATARYTTIAKPLRLKDFAVKLEVDPTTATSSRTFTIYVNGVASALTVTIAAGATTAQDSTNEVNVAVFDRVCVLSDGGVNVPLASAAYTSVRAISRQA